jgi:hypothetical protein
MGHFVYARGVWYQSRHATTMALSTVEQGGVSFQHLRVQPAFIVL